MKQRIVVGLTLLFLVGLSAFVSTTVIQNQQKNAFEDLQLTSETSPNPDASATTTSTPNPCASPSATASAGVGSSPTPVGSSESNINRGEPTPTLDPSSTPTPCPSPSPGDGTATATTTVTATPTPTVDASSTVGITPRPMRSPTTTPTPKKSPTPAATPTACPTQDDGSYTDPKCDSVSVRLLYQVHDKDPQSPRDKPKMRLNQTKYPINGRIDDIKVRFYCKDLPQITVDKEVNERGIASVSVKDMGCTSENIKAKVLKYLVNDQANQIPRKETTRMYYLYFSDFDQSDQKNEVGNYIGRDGSVNIDTDIGLVVKDGKKEREVIGVQPAVGGIAKVDNNEAQSRTVCFSYLYLENLGANFPCSDAQTMIRTKTDKYGWYMFGTNKRPWSPETPLLNNFDDRLNFGKFITLVKQGHAKNVFVTAQNTETNHWIEFDAMKNNPKPLIGRHGEGVAGKDNTKWNRKDCGCLDRTEDIIREALKYVVPGGGKTYNCPCAGYVSAVIADSYTTGGKTYQGVGLISGRHGSDAVNTLRANLSNLYAKKGFWQQNWPSFNVVTGWESGYRKDDANIVGTYTNSRYKNDAVAGDVVTATIRPGTPGGGGNHAWIFLGTGNDLISNYRDILGGVIIGRIRANGAHRFYAIGTTGQNVGPRVMARRGNVALTDAQNQGFEGHYWATFSARCWNDWQ